MIDRLSAVLKSIASRKVQQTVWLVGGCMMAIALLLSGCQLSIPTGPVVQVMRVASGQTIEIPDPTGQTALNQAVRLIGISAPDTEQTPWGLQARNFLEAQIHNQPVRLESDVTEMDAYHRRLAYVWSGKVLLNEKLVEEGLVLADVRSPNLKYEDRLKHAQETARILGRGIWNPNQPMRQLPGEFRRQQESATQP